MRRRDPHHSGAAGKHLQRLWSAEGAALTLGVLQGLVVARALGPDRYGVYALALTFVAFVFLVLDPRAGDSVVKYLAEFVAAGDVGKSRAVVRAGLLLDMTWGAAGLLLVSALATPAGALLHIQGDADLIPVVALGLSVAAPVATSRAVLSVFERFDAISNRQFAVALLRALSVGAVALGGLGLSGVIWTLTIVSVLECVLFVSAAISVAAQRLDGPGIMTAPLSALRGHRREMARFLALSGLTTLASSAIKQVDTLLVGVMAGPREAGYYRLAKSLTAPASNVGGPLQTVLYPRLARAESQGDLSRADQLVRRTFVRAGLPLALLAVISLPLVQPVVHLLAGRAFDGAVGPSIALVLGVAVSFATLHLRPMFLVRNQMRPLLLFTVIASALSLAAFFPAAASFGADGVAWTRTVVLGLVSGVMAAYLHRRAARRGAERLLSPDLAVATKEPT